MIINRNSYTYYLIIYLLKIFLPNHMYKYVIIVKQLQFVEWHASIPFNTECHY